MHASRRADGLRLPVPLALAALLAACLTPAPSGSGDAAHVLRDADIDALQTAAYNLTVYEFETGRARVITHSLAQRPVVVDATHVAFNQFQRVFILDLETQETRIVGHGNLAAATQSALYVVGENLSRLDPAANTSTVLYAPAAGCRLDGQVGIGTDAGPLAFAETCVQSSGVDSPGNYRLYLLTGTQPTPVGFGQAPDVSGDGSLVFAASDGIHLRDSSGADSVAATAGANEVFQHPRFVDKNTAAFDVVTFTESPGGVHGTRGPASGHEIRLLRFDAHTFETVLRTVKYNPLGWDVLAESRGLVISFAT